MEKFSFDNIAEVKSATQSLKSDMIHEVTFDGCIQDKIESTNTNMTYNILKIKFSNKDGVFSDTIFEPKESDFEDIDRGTFKSPSNVTVMMLKFKHLIDAINPSLGNAISKKEKNINANSWDGLCKFMIDSTNEFIGSKTKIKLIQNRKGEATFPFFAAFSRSNTVYMKTNFIGNNITFTVKEQEDIKNRSTAKPTNMTASLNDFSSINNVNEIPSVNIETTKEIPSDLNFDL